MRNKRRIVKSIALAGGILGGINILQDCSVVYAAELEETRQDDMGGMMEELGAAASASSSEDTMLSEKMKENPVSDVIRTAVSERADEATFGSETPGETVASVGTAASAGAAASVAGMELFGKSAGQDMAARYTHYSNKEWAPTHGYRGLGSWDITRQAVENACVNEGLELTQEELDEGADIWFYSGVTLRFSGGQYGSGWNAFIAWFERVSGEKTPNFDEEELENIRIVLNGRTGAFTSEDSGAGTSAFESAGRREAGSYAAEEMEAGTGQTAADTARITYATAREEEAPPLAVREQE